MLTAYQKKLLLPDPRFNTRQSPPMILFQSRPPKGGVRVLNFQSKVEDFYNYLKGVC